jgi:hypothetical protein
MKRLWMFLCAITIVFLVGEAQAAMPIDMLRIDEVSKVIEANYRQSDPSADREIQKGFFNLAAKNAIDLAKAENIYEAGHFSSSAFADHVSAKIGSKVNSALQRSSAFDRKNALYALLRTTSTLNASHAIITSWLKLPAETEIKPYKNASPPSLADQIRTSSNDPRLGIYVPPMELISEFGGPGEGNHLVDAGEWIGMTLGIYNKSDMAFFSSSAYVEDRHACAWTAKSKEILLPELKAETENEEETKPGEDSPPLGKVRVWVYITRSCANGTSVPVNIYVEDTHATKQGKIVLTVQVKVNNRGPGNVAGYLVDGDVAGYSEGSKDNMLSKGVKLELSHGLEAAYGVQEAQMSWAVKKEALPVFKEVAYRTGEPLLVKGKRLYPSDDLDLEVHSAKEYNDRFEQVDSKGGWISRSDPKAWFVSETEALYNSDYQQRAMESNFKVEICDNYIDDDWDGKHDCDDSDCKEEAACEPPDLPPDPADILKLFKHTATLEPSIAAKTHPGALSAVMPHFELVVAEERFKTEYACLVEKIPIKLCYEDREEPEKKKKEEKEKAEAPSGSQIHYKYRHYFSLDLESPPQLYEICGNGIDDDRDRKIDCKDSDCPPCPPPPPKDDEWRISLGLETGKLKKINPDIISDDEVSFEWNSIEEQFSTGLSLDAAYQKGNVFGAIGIFLTPITPIINDGELGFKQKKFDIGIGYSHVNGEFIFEPSLGLGYRKADFYNTQRTLIVPATVAINLSLMTRYAFSESTWAYIQLGRSSPLPMTFFGEQDSYPIGSLGGGFAGLGIGKTLGATTTGKPSDDPLELELFEDDPLDDLLE